MFKHGCRYDEAEAEVAGYKIPLGIAILGLVAAARGECEGGNQEEEKFCLFHITCILLFCVAKVRKRNEKACGEARKVTAEGASLHICSEIH